MGRGEIDTDTKMTTTSEGFFNTTSEGFYNTTSEGFYNTTSQSEGFLASSEAPDHSMALLLQGYSVTLVVICGTSLILGFPVAYGMLWHLRVATNASGRGVLR